MKKEASHQGRMQFLNWISVILFIVSILSLSWGLYLNYQLSKTAETMKTCHSISKQISSSEDHSSEEIRNYDKRQENDSNPEKGFLFRKIKESIDSPTTQHTIVKRSSGASNRNERVLSKKKRRNSRSRIKKLLSKNKAIAIHVQAKKAKESSIPVVGGTALTNFWQYSEVRPSIFGTSQLNHSGYVTAPASGFYYLYAQVVFNATGQLHVSAEIAVGTYSLNTFTKCLSTLSRRDKNRFSTCHLSGVKYLKKGDWISAMVQPHNVKIRVAPQFTYFGAFMIGL